MKRIIYSVSALLVCLFAAACNEEAQPSGKTDDGGKLVITATLPSGSITGKTVWEDGDKLNFVVIKDGSKLSETMAPKSTGGASATFEFSSFFPSNPDACYAWLAGSGPEFVVDGTAVQVPEVNSASGSLFPVTVGSASGGKLELRNVYSHISFVTETTGLSHAILEGRNSEVVSRTNLVGFDGTVTPVEGGASSTSITVQIYGAGTYYIPLYPGVVFSEGYKITVYGTDGRVKMTAESKEPLTVGSSQVYAAPAFVEGASQSGIFDASKVVCSFAMLSDTHINTSNAQSCEDKLANAFAQLKAQASKDDPDGLDAVCVAGDLIDYGGNLSTQLPAFKSIYEAAFDPQETPLVYTIGNHDPNTSYWWTSAVYSFAASMRSAFGSKYETTDIEKTMRDSYECRHCVVGDYHILAVTPNSIKPVAYPAEIKNWLDSTLKSITEADPNRYVILLTHPMIYDTVYGSKLGPDWLNGSCGDQWYTKDLTSILAKYPQVMTFGGHLHFPINDPRSIWQGDFTSFGCGSTRYMAIEDGQYENMSSATVMADCSEVSSGLLLQFDAAGNARITRMFFSQNTTFGYPWEIARPAADKEHLKTYNHAALKAANTAPTLSSLDVTLVDATSSSKTVFAKFSAGQDDDFVHHYVLKLKKGSSVLSTKRILADFYKHQWPDQMAASWTQNMGNYENGDYTLELEAYDSWDAVATLTKNFTVSAGSSTPSASATLYADIDFTSGKASDNQGKLKVTNHDATIGSVKVTHGGKSGSLEAMTASGTKAVECQFTAITSTSAFQEFASKGFSVEAFYVDRSPGPQVHGVVCGTEKGGWGIATRATGVPYFIVGDVSSNKYVNIDAESAASKTDLTHVVAVYDYSKKAILLYVNGVLAGRTSITGPFYPGEGNTYNRFYLGADVKTTDTAVDFPSVDMVIADAKIYTGVMDEQAVKAAYTAAVGTIK